MRTTLILFGVAIAAILTTATSRSGTSAGDISEAANVSSVAPEPISGTVIMPDPGNERPYKSPFAPYPTGQEAVPATLWTYESLGPQERAQADRDKAQDFRAINSAFATNTKLYAERARAEAAATQLGTSNLDTTGVMK